MIGVSRYGMTGHVYRVTYPNGGTEEFKAETWVEAVREIGSHAIKLEVIDEYTITEEDDD